MSLGRVLPLLFALFILTAQSDGPFVFKVGAVFGNQGQCSGKASLLLLDMHLFVRKCALVLRCWCLVVHICVLSCSYSFVLSQVFICMMCADVWHDFCSIL
jgi:hypothetical protein